MDLKRPHPLSYGLLMLGISLSSPALANPPVLNPPQVTGDGLYGQYYNYSFDPLNDPSFPSHGTLAMSRIDPVINFNWSSVPAAPSVQQSLMGVIWSGYLYVPYDGFYTFQTQSDDGIAVWVSNSVQIDDWTLHSNTLDNSVWYNYGYPTYLYQGYTPIMVNYFQNTGQAIAQLSWEYYGASDFNYWFPLFSPDPNAFAMTTIPQANLFSGQPLLLNGVSQSCGLLNQIELDFSEPVNTTTATVTGNYQINGGNNPRVVRAQINPVNPDSVLLQTSPALVPGTTYRITVTNVADTAGYAIATGSVATLTPQNGTQLLPGLLGRYFDQNGQANAFFTGKEVDRVDATLNFPALSANWPASGIPSTNFSTEWDGYVVPKKTDDYTFSETSDDGSTLQLSGNTLINMWQLQSATTANSSTIHLRKNQYYPVHVQYFQGPGQSVMQLGWNSASTGAQIIPASNLYYCATSQAAALSLSASTPASTCSPDSVQITAVDASGHPVNTFTGSISISTSSAHGTWSLGTGQGLFTAGAPDSGQASYTFVSADQGTVTLQLMDVHADTLQISAVGSGLSGNSLPLSFKDNAFLISSIDALGNNIVAGRPQQLQAQLWTRNPSTGNQCAIATQYNGSYALQSWITRGSADPGGAAPSINGQSLPNNLPGSNNLSLSFSAGTAQFPLSTTDVGQWTLNLQDSSSGFAQGLSGAANPISGASPVFVARPFGFAIDFANDRLTHGLNNSALSYADNANDYPWFVKAGNPFAMTVQAVLWNAAQDLNNDGIPDAGANLLGDNLATHFNASVALAPVQILPNPGNLGTLSPLSLSNFTGGQASVSATYSEVGIINIQAQLTNYLGGTNSVTGLAPYVGRFVPDHLSLLPASTLLTPACGSGSTGFTYMGQPMNLQWQLQAQNLANTTTQNYYGAFAKLAVNGAQAAGMLFKAANVATTTTPLSSRLQLGTLSGNTWTAGQSTLLDTGLTLNSLSQPDGAFDAFNVGLAATDTDGIGLSGLNFSSSGGVNDAVLLGSTKERYGRLWLSAANGSELLPLSLPVTAQYYANLGSASGFITNTLDNCTAVPLTPVQGAGQFGVLQLSNPQGAITVAATTPSYIAPSTATLSSGQSSITLAAPGSTGSLEVSLPGVPAWLRLYPYNWLIPGLGSTIPAASATFGIYPGRAPVIYWHEQFR